MKVSKRYDIEVSILEMRCIALGFVFATLLSLSSCDQKSKIEKVLEFKEYASGSAMVFANKKLFVCGDDMPFILITDTALRVQDTIQLEEGNSRIPKDQKQDLEAATIIRKGRNSSLLLLGSGSVLPQRAKGWLIDIQTSQKRMLDITPFYKRLLSSGIPEVNIEGVTYIQGSLLLANRGNKSNPKNFLVFTSSDFFDIPEFATIRAVKLGASTDTASFSGVSGLDYSYRSDRLFLTVSTENTYSTSADGSIGKSYLWTIDNISTKRRLSAVNPTKIIDLESIDRRFTGHKIESVSILSETRKSYKLALVADDDKGTTVIFIMTLER